MGMRMVAPLMSCQTRRRVMFSALRASMPSRNLSSTATFARNMGEFNSSTMRSMAAERELQAERVRRAASERRMRRRVRMEWFMVWVESLGERGIADEWEWV